MKPTFKQFLSELYINPAELSSIISQTVEMIEDMKNSKQWNKLESASEIFANAKYRDDKEGMKTGLPFTTNGEELYRMLQTISMQGDELFPKRLFRKISEINNV